MRGWLPALLLLLACDDRVAPLEARLTETRAEVERLSRDVAHLRSRPAGTTSGGEPSAAESLRLAQLDATLDALLTALPLPPATGGLDGLLPGVWRTESALSTEELVHLRSDGRLCGWRRATTERVPYWGRWERHGRVLVELRDRWVGDRNELASSVRRLDRVTADELDLAAGLAEEAPRARFRRVTEADWKPLASLYPDRAVPIPGLPTWCLAAR